jgi:hypothetical protein
VTRRERTCDGCGSDLTLSNRPQSWHYTLKAEPTPHAEFMVVSPMTQMPGTRHFCGDVCVEKWVTTVMKAVVGDVG